MTIENDTRPATGDKALALPFPRLFEASGRSPGELRDATGESPFLPLDLVGPGEAVKGLEVSPPTEPQLGPVLIAWPEAVAQAQHRRERQIMPEDYRFPAAKFWEANPGLEPELADTKAKLQAAARAGELEIFIDRGKGPERFPASSLNAPEDCVNLDSGFINIGRATLPPRQGIGLPVPSEQGKVIYTPFIEFIRWCRNTWPAPRDATSGDSGDDRPGLDAGEQLEAAPAVPRAHPVVHAEKRKRGPKEHWNWEPIDAQAANLYALSNGSMPWKVLVETIQALGKQQTGTAPSGTTAERRAARIRDASLKSASNPTILEPTS